MVKVETQLNGLRLSGSDEYPYFCLTPTMVWRSSFRMAVHVLYPVGGHLQQTRSHSLWIPDRSFVQGQCHYVVLPLKQSLVVLAKSCQ
jgi:hypothetical protein